MSDPHEPDPFERLLDEHRAQTDAPERVVAVDDGDGGDGHYVHLRHPRGGGGRRWGMFALGLLVVVALVLGSAGWWVKRQVDPGSRGAEVASFTIPSSSTTSDVANLLQRAGIITNATVFQWYLRLTHGSLKFQAGEYDGLHRNSSMSAVVSRLQKGPLPPKDVTFLVREGLWLSETKALILKTFPDITPEALDQALTSIHPSLQPQGSTNLEGFLFPATYKVPENQTSDANALVNQMVGAFDQVAGETGLANASQTLQGVAGKTTITPYDALIVASLVESEAKVPEDRPKIARVIYNRLAQGMDLGIDATVLYAIGERTSSLTTSQLNTDSPYNTRKHPGLPPTPINSPGKASIEAALHPAQGDWLYYVLTDKDGHHYFTNSYSDFQRAVRDAQARGVF